MCRFIPPQVRIFHRKIHISIELHFSIFFRYLWIYYFDLHECKSIHRWRMLSKSSMDTCLSTKTPLHKLTNLIYMYGIPIWCTKIKTVSNLIIILLILLHLNDFTYMISNWSTSPESKTLEHTKYEPARIKAHCIKGEHINER